MHSLKHVRPMKIQHYIYELSRDDRPDLPVTIRLDDINCRDAPALAVANLGRSIKRTARPVNLAVEVSLESRGWFDEEFFRILGTELTGAVCVRTFYLDFHSRSSSVDAPFGDAELSHFVPFLTINTSLQTLGIDGSEIGPEGFRFLHGVVSSNRDLDGLIFRSCRNLDDDAMGGLVSALQHSGTKLKTLELARTRMSAAGIETVCAYAARSQSIERLVLERQNFNEAGLDHLCVSLKSTGCSLEHLEIASSNIADSGARNLADALALNRSLKSCILVRCRNITDVGAQALLRAIFNGDSLKGIVNSNHSLRNLTFVHPGMSEAVRSRDATIRKLYHHVGGSDLDVVRRKVEYYLGKESGVKWDSIAGAVVDLKIGIMPHVLSLFDRKNGLNLIFETMRHWNMPAFFLHYSHVTVLEGRLKVFEEMMEIEKKKSEMLHDALVSEKKENTRLRKRLGLNDLEVVNSEEGCRVS